MLSQQSQYDTIILIGPPGSGKGSLAQKLIKKHKTLKHLSTGDLLRQEVNLNGPLSSEITSYLEKGLLVPDELVTRLLENAIKKNNQQICVFDGYPRNKNQVNIFKELIKDKKACIFTMDIDEEILVTRLSSRVICPSCQAIFNTVSYPSREKGICDHCQDSLKRRSDDAPDIVRKRLQGERERSQEIIKLLDFCDQVSLKATQELEFIIKDVEKVIWGLENPFNI